MEGHFFSGDLFVDKTLEAYQRLGLPRQEAEQGVQAQSAAAGLFRLAGKVGGNLLDINAQLGGTYVVQAGGKVLMEHLQQDAGDYLENDYILQALKIEVSQEM